MGATKVSKLHACNPITHKFGPNIALGAISGAGAIPFESSNQEL